MDDPEIPCSAAAGGAAIGVILVEATDDSGIFTGRTAGFDPSVLSPI
jgi:hypothetical protein